MIRSHERFGETIEMDWAIDQLIALGYLESKGFGKNDKLRITDKGMVHARDILAKRLDLPERLLSLLYHGEIIKTLRYEVEDGWRLRLRRSK